MKETDEFWLNWMEADALERLKLVKTLPIWEESNMLMGMALVSPTLLNSYLEDLYRAVGCFGYDEDKIPNGEYKNRT